MIVNDIDIGDMPIFDLSSDELPDTSFHYVKFSDALLLLGARDKRVKELEAGLKALTKSDYAITRDVARKTLKEASE